MLPGRLFTGWRNVLGCAGLMFEGRILAGRYRLISKLGEGGMGSVWRAEHLTLGSQVAIKLIDPSIADSAEALGRFKREAQAAAELRSVHVVHITDYGVDNNVPFIAMELLEGESLAARLERVGRLSPQETAFILSQVARGLARAHDKGIVHRDLKPDNIFLVREGEEDVAKVFDFGVAKKMGSLSASSGVKTRTGALLGTPYYLSPEQALGKSDVDHRADIWALGIIAYECIVGVRPFDNEALGALLNAICHEPLPIPSSVAELPSGFDAWFARACARIPAERFESAAQALVELRMVCGLPSVRPSTVPAAQSSGDTVLSAELRPQLHKPSDLPLGMDNTGVPSSVTINKGGQSPIKWVGLMVGLSLLLVAIGVAVLRSVKSPATLQTSASVLTAQPFVQLSSSPQQTPLANANGSKGVSPSSLASESPDRGLPPSPMAPTPSGMLANLPTLHPAAITEPAKSHVKSAPSSVAVAAPAAMIASAAPLPAPPSSAAERPKTRSEKAGLKQSNPFSTPGAP